MGQGILALVKEMVAAWKEYISNREKNYRVDMDKRMRIAIEAAEKYIMNDMQLDQLAVGGKEPLKEAEKIRKRKKYYQKRFFKYN